MKLEDLEKAGQATDYKGIIARYLFNFANEDEHFKQKLLETNKTLEGCIRYIESEAKKVAVNSCAVGCAVVEGNVVYQQARHYFLEDSINNEVKASQPKTTSKPAPQGTDENEDESDDTEEIKNKEIDLNEQEEASNGEDEQEVKEETKPRKTAKKDQKTAQDEQPSLFDFEF